MLSRYLTPDLTEITIFVPLPGECTVVFVENSRDAGALFGGIRRRERNIVHRNLFNVQFPRDKIHVPKPPKPSVDPFIESKRCKFAGKLAVMRSENLKIVKRIPVPRGPRHEG